MSKDFNQNDIRNKYKLFLPYLPLIKLHDHDSSEYLEHFRPKHQNLDQQE